jgi:hypothetical protein
LITLLFYLWNIAPFPHPQWSEATSY